MHYVDTGSARCCSLLSVADLWLMQGLCCRAFRLAQSHVLSLASPAASRLRGAQQEWLQTDSWLVEEHVSLI